MISPKWSLLICSFVCSMKSQQMWKMANKNRHTQRERERTPLSVLIANFVYIPHFSCASSFSMSNNILSLDCAHFFRTLLSFGLATYFAARPFRYEFIFCLFACTIHRIIFMELVLLMNWQNIKNASIILFSSVVSPFFISLFPGIKYTWCRRNTMCAEEKFELENCRKWRNAIFCRVDKSWIYIYNTRDEAVQAVGFALIAYGVQCNTMSMNCKREKSSNFRLGRHKMLNDMKVKWAKNPIQIK